MNRKEYLKRLFGMSESWIDKKKKFWPTGLENYLKLKEAKNLVDAVQKQVRDNYELKALKKQLEINEVKAPLEESRDEPSELWWEK